MFNKPDGVRTFLVLWGAFMAGMVTAAALIFCIHFRY
jgi:hypothetical protein